MRSPPKAIVLCLALAALGSTAYAEERVALDGLFSAPFPASPVRADRAGAIGYTAVEGDLSYQAIVTEEKLAIADKADLEKAYGEMWRGIAAGGGLEPGKGNLVDESGLAVYEFTALYGGLTGMAGKFYFARGKVYTFIETGLVGEGDPFSSAFFEGIAASAPLSFDADQRNSSGSAAFDAGKRIGSAIGLPAIAAVIAAVVIARRKRRKAAGGK